jgi:hypothetical protein
VQDLQFRLTYAPSANEFGDNFDWFTFKATDFGGADSTAIAKYTIR